MVKIRPQTPVQWAITAGAIFGLPPSLVYFPLTGLEFQWYDFFVFTATVMAWSLGAVFWRYLVERGGNVTYGRGAVVGFLTALLTHIGVVVLSLPLVWGAAVTFFVSVSLAPFSIPTYAAVGALFVAVRKRYSVPE